MSTRLVPRGTGVRQGQADPNTVTQQRHTLGGPHKRPHCDPEALWVMGADTTKEEHPPHMEAGS